LEVLSQSNKQKEEHHVVQLVHPEIQKWLKLLAENIDMQAPDAVKYIYIIRNELPKLLATQFQKFVTVCVSYVHIYIIKCLHLHVKTVTNQGNRSCRTTLIDAVF